jgi:hypothetical protein
MGKKGRGALRELIRASGRKPRSACLEQGILISFRDLQTKSGMLLVDPVAGRNDGKCNRSFSDESIQKREPSVRLICVMGASKMSFGGITREFAMTESQRSSLVVFCQCVACSRTLLEGRRAKTRLRSRQVRKTSPQSRLLKGSRFPVTQGSVRAIYWVSPILSACSVGPCHAVELIQLRTRCFVSIAARIASGSQEVEAKCGFQWVQSGNSRPEAAPSLARTRSAPFKDCRTKQKSTPSVVYSLGRHTSSGAFANLMDRETDPQILEDLVPLA